MTSEANFNLKIAKRLATMKNEFPTSSQSLNESIIARELNLIQNQREENLWKKRAHLYSKISVRKIDDQEQEQAECKNQSASKSIQLTEEDSHKIAEIIKASNSEEYSQLLPDIPVYAALEENAKKLIIDDCVSLLCENANKQIMGEMKDISEMQYLLKAIASFCKKKNGTEFFMFKPALNGFYQYLIHITSDPRGGAFETITKMILKIIVHLTDCFSRKVINHLSAANMEKPLLDCLNIPNEYIQGYALRIVGNMITREDAKSQKVIEAGLLGYLKIFMCSSNISMRKDSIWMVSNILAGSREQAEEIIRQGFFKLLKQAYYNDGNCIKREAIWAICNMSNIKNPYLAEGIIQEGIIEILCDVLSHLNPKYLIIALEALDAFIELDITFFRIKTENWKDSEIRSRLREQNFEETIEGLQYHSNQHVYEKVSELLEKYLDYLNL